MNFEGKRIMAVDPGEKNIGVAISDPTKTLAQPLTVIRHASLAVDCAQIAALADENNVGLILVGVPTGINGEEIPQTRHAMKLIGAIKTQSSVQIIAWDEWGSTRLARSSMIEAGAKRSVRGGHQDALAAAMILRSYLDKLDSEKA